jgi:hypothetical protein
MLTKRLIVLANSFKYGGRCIAGRELIAHSNTYRPGDWVRPLSAREGGEFMLPELRLSTGRPVQVRDVIDIPLGEPVGDPFQPENWHLGPGPWQLVRTPTALPLTWLEETPPDLWHEPGNRSDRTSDEFLKVRPPRQSLVLIRPQNFRLQVAADPNKDQPRRRALFCYRGLEYDLHITDPVFWDSYRCKTPQRHERPITFTLRCGDDVLLCISLTRDFHGYHYKVVATIFEEVPMSDSLPPTLYTIGHSNHEWAAFLQLLARHQITAVADVRSSPYSRFNPQYNREPLQKALEAAGIRYVFLGQELGARRSEEDCYENDRVSYSRVAQSPLFQEGLQRLQRGMEKYRIALLCAEKDPLFCHRTILVCRHLRGQGIRLQHILETGDLEAQEEAEDRLLVELDLAPDNLFESRSEIVEQAYDKQGKKIAFVRQEDSSSSEE